MYILYEYFSGPLNPLRGYRTPKNALLTEPLKAALYEYMDP